jgi:hypothetical protein
MSITPESDIFHSFEANFGKFDEALQDPFITAVLADVNELNELLVTEVTTLEDAREIIQTLDTMWGVLNDSTMKVTGNIAFLSPEGIPQTRYYEDAEMISKGFVVSGDPSDPEAYAGRHIKLAFLMEIPKNLRGEYGEVTEGTHLIGQAEIDQVELVATVHSVEHAKAWLTEFHPEIIDEIDSRLFNIENEADNTDSLLALQDFVIPEIEGDVSTRNITLECVAAYLMGTIRLEQKIPYVTRISGRILLLDAEDSFVYAHISVKKRMIYVHGITILELSDVDYSTDETSNLRTEIFLESTLINDDPEGSDIQARIPLDSLNGLESFRRIL